MPLGLFKKRLSKSPRLESSSSCPDLPMRRTASASHAVTRSPSSSPPPPPTPRPVLRQVKVLLDPIQTQPFEISLDPEAGIEDVELQVRRRLGLAHSDHVVSCFKVDISPDVYSAALDKTHPSFSCSSSSGATHIDLLPYVRSTHLSACEGSVDRMFPVTLSSNIQLLVRVGSPQSVSVVARIARSAQPLFVLDILRTSSGGIQDLRKRLATRFGVEPFDFPENSSLALWRVDMTPHEMVQCEDFGGLKDSSMPWPYPPNCIPPTRFMDRDTVELVYRDYVTNGNIVSMSIWMPPTAVRQLPTLVSPLAGSDGRVSLDSSKLIHERLARTKVRPTAVHRPRTAPSLHHSDPNTQMTSRPLSTNTSPPGGLAPQVRTRIYHRPSRSTSQLPTLVSAEVYETGQPLNAGLESRSEISRGPTRPWTSDSLARSSANTPLESLEMESSAAYRTPVSSTNQPHTGILPRPLSSNRSKPRSSNARPASSPLSHVNTSAAMTTTSSPSTVDLAPTWALTSAPPTQAQAHASTLRTGSHSSLSSNLSTRISSPSSTSLSSSSTAPSTTDSHSLFSSDSDSAERRSSKSSETSVDSSPLGTEVDRLKKLTL